MQMLYKFIFNPAQELVMEEGDREFKGIIDNIEAIVNQY